MGLGEWVEIGRMDELGQMDSPVHRVDARAKILTTLIFIVLVMSFPRYTTSALMPFFLYPVFLLALGRIPPGYLLRKVLVASPFAIAVGIFNPLLDTQPAAAIGSLVISGGWLSFCSILLRFVLTVTAALALAACTGMFRLGAGLERLGMPRALAVQLLFLYRYLFVVTNEGLTMLRSVELRSGGLRALPLRWYGPLVGHLLLRSLDRAERIHRAMTARGFNGEIQTLRRDRFGPRDALFVLGWTLFFFAARTWNLAEALGSFFMGSPS